MVFISPDLPYGGVCIRFSFHVHQSKTLIATMARQAATSHPLLPYLLAR